MSNGKGDRDRTFNREAYRKNHEAVFPPKALLEGLEQCKRGEIGPGPDIDKDLEDFEDDATTSQE